MRKRPLGDSQFPLMLIDAMYLKVQEDGRVRSRGLLIAIGVNNDGYVKCSVICSVTRNMKRLGERSSKNSNSVDYGV